MVHAAADTTHATVKAHLEGLARALNDRDRLTRLVEGDHSPYLKVRHPRVEALAEVIRCKDTSDGWQFLWQWGAPIGPVREVEAVADTVARVLRAADE